MLLRRVYLYVVSLAALGLLVAGVSLLGATILVFVFNDPSAQSSRPQLAVFGAMTLVAAPVWAVHFWFGRRFSRRDPSERASALRRLYLYLASLLLVGALAGMTGALTGELLGPKLDLGTWSGLVAAQEGWAIAVLGTFWILHARLAAADRAAAGEGGASATLRRWYMYAAQLAGLLTMLAGADGLIASAWLRFFEKADQFAAPLAGPIAALLAGFALWAVHARMTSRGAIAADDRQSTLRAISGFLAAFITLLVALVGLSQALYNVLARELGVSSPGGVPVSLPTAIAGPLASAAVYGAAWLLVRRRLERDAAGGEAARQAGVRRLHSNLASLVSLGAAAIGAGGVLWVAGEQLGARIIGVAAPGWRDQLSLWVTLLLVGAAVWRAHWHQAPAPPERQSLSRRLYVYAALLVSVLALLGSAVATLNAILRQLVSSSPELADPANLDVFRFLAVLLVAVAVGVYHWRVLRADHRARPAPVAAPAADAVAPARHRYELELVGAGTEDLQRALAALPPGSSYRVLEQVP